MSSRERGRESAALSRSLAGVVSSSRSSFAAGTWPCHCLVSHLLLGGQADQISIGGQMPIRRQILKTCARKVSGSFPPPPLSLLSWLWLGTQMALVKQSADSLEWPVVVLVFSSGPLG